MRAKPKAVLVDALSSALDPVQSIEIERSERLTCGVRRFTEAGGPAYPNEESLVDQISLSITLYLCVFHVSSPFAWLLCDVPSWDDDLSLSDKLSIL